MAKGFIFRRIRGRLIPIRTSLSKGNLPNTSKLSVTSLGKDGGATGRLFVSITKGKSANLDAVQVYKSFRNKGLSSRLFKKAAQFLRRTTDVKFLRGNDIVNAAQIKIRSKHKSKFIASGLGHFGEGSKIVSAKEAIRLLKKSNDPSNLFNTTIKASTRIRKNG